MTNTLIAHAINWGYDENGHVTMCSDTPLDTDWCPLNMPDGYIFQAEPSQSCIPVMDENNLERVVGYACQAVHVLGGQRFNSEDDVFDFCAYNPQYNPVTAVLCLIEESETVMASQL